MCGTVATVMALPLSDEAAKRLARTTEEILAELARRDQEKSERLHLELVQ